MRILGRGRVAMWTREKISSLSTPELRQLHQNAERLHETEVATLCAEVLGARPRSRAAVRRPRRKGSAGRLVARSKAFELRGVSLQNRFWSRGGVRPSDGMVVVALWAEDVQRANAVSSCLLWAPNVAGSRPWSDKLGGKERLAHCRLAAERGAAEGLLVYGTRLEGSLPEDRALSVDGVDPENVLELRVDRRGDEYWATWGNSNI
ncbi:MAG: hypothetical protein A2Z64_07725 [Betaproteobacteria bacterium RIFCSPLOWO2_02_67_12]|nr:MAG: hypothetical protein A2Z64_07725 [Betaproteobacteria bacterium RIFCSPLOWO2_02_67_12]OGA29119.1 MAG: hypothetical protein A3I65_11800 [Betaproteobacteria bacterium RIFCSPLOWO2_02_FULL_68_150]OGA72546.1 MAG: hypothetical protein A3F77_04760 [Betaproteobacteria bacterium RIFCSPLOWO2_12_FULL_67_28]